MQRRTIHQCSKEEFEKKACVCECGHPAAKDNHCVFGLEPQKKRKKKEAKVMRLKP